jgi:hypothetical protein
MDIKVDVDAEAINAAVTKAILDSAIGAEMKRAIETTLSNLSRSYNNPIKDVVDKIVNEEIYKIVTTQHMEAIRAAIQENITDAVISEMTEKAWSSFISKY